MFSLFCLLNNLEENISRFPTGLRKWEIEDPKTEPLLHQNLSSSDTKQQNTINRPKVKLTPHGKVYTTDFANIGCLSHLSLFFHICLSFGTHHRYHHNHDDNRQDNPNLTKNMHQRACKLYNLPSSPLWLSPLGTSPLSFPALCFHLKTTNVIVNISHKILSTKHKTRKKKSFPVHKSLSSSWK